ncbi:hypothetical protein C4580_01565 [Candidatus Woesearchaeota archaeon]|nr:MAG: hypothetical protein C4580_01565 [Candidatus Woesearchaeota archaeon]
MQQLPPSIKKKTAPPVSKQNLFAPHDAQENRAPHHSSQTLTKRTRKTHCKIGTRKYPSASPITPEKHL